MAKTLPDKIPNSTLYEFRHLLHYVTLVVALEQIAEATNIGGWCAVHTADRQISVQRARAEPLGCRR